MTNVPAADRLRRSWWTTSASLGSRGLGVLVFVFAVPILIDHLGVTAYGVFATTTTIALAIASTDLGIGNGLVTLTSQAAERNDSDALRSIVSSGLLLLVGVAVTAATIGGLAVTTLDWQEIFKLGSPTDGQASRDAVLVAVLVSCGGIPFLASQKIQLGLQQGYENGAWVALGHLLSLAGIVIGIEIGVGVAGVVGLWLAAPIVMFLVQTLWLVQSQRIPRPKLSAVTLKTVRHLLGVGSGYFLLQLAYIVMFTLDNLIVASTAGSSAVTTFALHAQPFLWLMGALNAYLISLWPAYAAALANEDERWAYDHFRSTVRRTVSFAAATGVGLTIFGPRIVEVWVDGAIEGDRALFGLFSLLTVVMVGGGSISIFLNAAHRVGFQAVTAALMIFFAILGKVVGATLFGLRGLVGATLVAYVVITLLPTVVYVKRTHVMTGDP